MCHFPYTLDKATRADHTISIPRNSLIKWAHKHFIEAQSVGTESGDDIIRIDDITKTLTHLAPIRTHNETYVLELAERLGGVDQSRIKKHLMPKTRIDE